MQGANFSVEVADAARDFEQYAMDNLAAAGQQDRDAAELESRKLYMPHEGRAELLNQSCAEAEQRGRNNDAGAERAWSAIEAGLIQQALPSPPRDPGAQSLVRQELQVALDGATGPEFAARMVRIASGPNRDMAAVLLNSSYGLTLAESRGLTGRAQAEAFTAARRAAAAAALQHGTGVGELVAGAALKKIGRLAACRSISGSILSQSVSRARQSL
jgi:hypothetical protein